jgi:hypothetical protein
LVERKREACLKDAPSAGGEKIPAPQHTNNAAIFGGVVFID